MKTKLLIALLSLVCCAAYPAGVYKCYTIFDGASEPVLPSGVIKWNGPTNFWGVIPVGGNGYTETTEGTLAKVTAVPTSNSFTRIIGPITTASSNVLLSFGFRGMECGTNRVTFTGSGTAAVNTEFTWNDNASSYTPGGRYTNGGTLVLYFEPDPANWRITNTVGAAILYTNVGTLTGGTWVKGAQGSATVPTCYFSGTNEVTDVGVSLGIAWSWDATNTWTHLGFVTNTMNQTNWSHTAKYLTAGFQPCYPYFAVYGITNYAPAAPTNMYLRMYVRE